MEDARAGQVTKSAAEVYEEFFVPALFHAWAPLTADAAGAGPGRRLLDVACGTGVVAREAARRGASVTGLDRNEGMLEVARRKGPGLEWKAGRAEALPFADGAFDAVTCQFALMFFEDPVAALREMNRVLRPGGRLAVVVWEALERSPGYAAMAGLLRRLFGDGTAEALRAPFRLGDPAALETLFRSAGLPGAALSTVEGAARFPSIDAWVHTEIRGWTLADRLDEPQFERLLKEARRELASFAAPDGAVAFPIWARLATADKP